MNESRICPVCEKEIPEDAKFVCPNCDFELKWLDDEAKIERAKQKFSISLKKTSKGSLEDSQETSQADGFSCLLYFGYFFVGLIGTIVPIFIMSIILGFGGYNSPDNANILGYITLICMPSCALLAGIIVVKKKSSSISTLLSVVITVALSFLLSAIIGFVSLFLFPID